MSDSSKEHAAAEEKPRHFIRQLIHDDVLAGKHGGAVVTRFPPEPNGYLHIGHAKAICIDFGMAQEFGGRCHLRMDDTNPAKETNEYVEAIKTDVHWLGFDWGEHFYYSADYFDRMYECARELIRRNKAYVCELTQEQWKEYRGVPTRPGTPSPFRDRPAAESLDLFSRMRAGEFADGTLCVRAKIDMASPNLHLRDPVIYRIMRATHYRVGDQWLIYPTYDYAHPLEDAFEGVTHSLCTLEFEVHRPLYDWVLEALGYPESSRPHQNEFARLNLTYTVMSKRKLLELVRGGSVKGWDDPRMPTIAGMRRRGYPPGAIREFCERVGVTKYESLTDVAVLEHCVRDQLNKSALRRMAVLRPLRVILENIGETEDRAGELVNNPEDPRAGTRPIRLTREIWIEQDDFMAEPVSGFHRLSPGKSVRLRGAGFLTCSGMEKNPQGEVVAVRGTWSAPDTPMKVKATIHWVSARDAVDAEVRLYDRLFQVEDLSVIPESSDFKDFMNPDSLRVVTAKVEPALVAAAPGDRVQFERIGYFCADAQDHRAETPVFNRIVTLKDTWTKAQQSRA